ncbi:conserved putative ATP binding protein [Helicosporidium sp. ATCC 50920]|nr:conserved putative ATP binding protein [Helicosporidium sp. ATCC 50920]|eukprot:KDD74671.1 conserved putative ATP binding protein [Helicosporidium sp. ATCC 50920]
MADVERSLEQLSIKDESEASSSGVGNAATIIVIGACEAWEDELNENAVPGAKSHCAIPRPGMAGSGKTTFIERLQSHLSSRDEPGYLINLDPAAFNVLYEPNIDIRDTVDYKNVMEEYSLGPNGAILTSLNLYATRFDQVVSLLIKARDPPLRYVVVDTPGQIEAFTWSASGAIITESLASANPALVAYVIDTPRCTNPQTFMSNMLQACSILYKSRLPLLLVFNKTDVAAHEFALGWMEDWETFQTALDAESSYAASLSRSLSLVLDRFYAGLRTVGVSAVTGAGMDDFLTVVDACVEQYRKEYLPLLLARKEEMAEMEAKRKEEGLQALEKDLAEDRRKAGLPRPAPRGSMPAVPEKEGETQ